MFLFMNGPQIGSTCLQKFLAAQYLLHCPGFLNLLQAFRTYRVLNVDELGVYPCDQLKEPRPMEKLEHQIPEMTQNHSAQKPSFSGVFEKDLLNMLLPEGVGLVGLPAIRLQARLQPVFQQELGPGFWKIWCSAKPGPKAQIPCACQRKSTPDFSGLGKTQGRNVKGLGFDTSP